MLLIAQGFSSYYQNVPDACNNHGLTLVDIKKIQILVEQNAKRLVYSHQVKIFSTQLPECLYIRLLYSNNVYEYIMIDKITKRVINFVNLMQKVRCQSRSANYANDFRQVIYVCLKAVSNMIDFKNIFFKSEISLIFLSVFS